jgi:hypothetical protein
VRLAGYVLLLGLGLAPAALSADYLPGAPLQQVTGARADFALRCRGCHGFAGEGTPGHVPRLDGFVGLFTQVPGGRDYLMRVPGVARSVLDDARLAAVLNFMLATYGGDRTDPGFAPFTAAEVGAARRQVLLDRKAVRARLLAELRTRGLVAADEDGLGRSPERRG